MRHLSLRGRLPRVWPAVFLAQSAGTILLWVLLALGAGIDLAPSNLDGGSVYAPWPVTSPGSALCAAAWGTVVVIAIVVVLRPLLADQPQPPSTPTLLAAVAIGGYVPFALSHGFTTGDPQNGAGLPAFVLTSVLVRLATWRAESAPPSASTRTRRWPVVLGVVVALGVVVPWAALHPVRVADLLITDPDGSSTTSPSNARRTLTPGARQRVDLSIETVATVRLLEARPVVPDGLRAMATRESDESQALPRELRPADWLSPRFVLSFRRCDDRPVRVDTIRVRFVRLGRTISQTLPVPTPLTLRCERAAR